MRSAVTFAFVAIIGLAGPAAAQSGSSGKPELEHFIRASVAADIRHWDWPGTPHAVGGSAAIGGFLTSGISLDVEVHVPQFAQYRSVYVGPGGPSGSGAPVMEERRVQDNRVVTVAALAGFHPASRGRVRLGYLAGLAVNHSEKRFRVENRLVSAPADVTVHTVSTSGSSPAAAVGIDARLLVARRFALVPHVRAYLGYSTGLILRPAIGGQVSF
jgi:hypothetical protein